MVQLIAEDHVPLAGNSGNYPDIGHVSCREYKPAFVAFIAGNCVFQFFIKIDAA